MKRYGAVIALLICAAGLVYGIAQLLRLRFELSDVYPAYSSLRSDPLGSMALYESIASIPGVTMRRDYSTSNVLPDGRDTLFVLVAVQREAWAQFPEDLLAEIEKFVANGGRFVISIYPEAKPQRLLTSPVPAEPDPDEKPKATPHRDRWGVELQTVDLKSGASDSYEPVRVHNVTRLPLADSLNWHSGIVFTKLNPDWQPIYMRGTDPVVIERRIGRGSVVMATDSYFMSNEAMLKDRHPDVLAWMIGSSHVVVFDEAHLGVTESPGVATLMRKYRLQWLLASLLLLAGLFIWKSSFSLIPPYADREAQRFVHGKDAASGFVNLLRRNIPKADLLGTCFSEWKKSAPAAGTKAESRMQQAESVFNDENSLAAKKRDPVRAYRKIAEVLQTHTSKEIK